MKRACISLFLLMIFSQVTACVRSPQPTDPPGLILPTETLAAPSPLPTAPPSSTPIPTPTVTITPEPPTQTPAADISPTAEPTVDATAPPTGEKPGAQIKGRVSHPNGDGIEGVQIHYAFAAYSGNLLATTNSQGEYEGFIYIPHDETVRVWAELTGFGFKPGGGNKSWMNGEFAWRSYGTFEFVELDFIGTPQ